MSLSLTLHDALKVVSERCDGARQNDTVGFSGLDARFANDMAAKEIRTAKQEWYVARFVRKYRRQVVERFEARGIQITQGLKGAAKVAAVDAFLCSLVWEHQTPEKLAAASKPKFVVSAVVGSAGTVREFVVRFPYSYNMVETFKAAVSDWRDRRFDKTDPKDPKWIVQPTAQAVAALRTLVASHGFFATDGATAAMDKVSPSKVAA